MARREAMHRLWFMEASCLNIIHLVSKAMGISCLKVSTALILFRMVQLLVQDSLKSALDSQHGHLISLTQQAVVTLSLSLDREYPTPALATPTSQLELDTPFHLTTVNQPPPLPSTGTAS